MQENKEITVDIDNITIVTERNGFCIITYIYEDDSAMDKDPITYWADEFVMR